MQPVEVAGKCWECRRDNCAVHELCMDLSALERVWGYVLAAVIGAAGVSLLV